MDWSRASDAELTALQRALLEARFNGQSRDDDVWASPHVIDLHVAVVAEMGRRARDDDRERARLDTWLDWSRHTVEGAILTDKLRHDPVWASLETRDQRVDYLRSLLRPFTAGERVLEDLAGQDGPG